MLGPHQTNFPPAARSGTTGLLYPTLLTQKNTFCYQKRYEKKSQPSRPNTTGWLISKIQCNIPSSYQKNVRKQKTRGSTQGKHIARINFQNPKCRGKKNKKPV